MNEKLRNDANIIIKESIASVMPDEAVGRALKAFVPGKGRVILVAAGKAAWQMTSAAVRVLGKVDAGVVITKYGHVMGSIPGVRCFEAGHPVPDENSFSATKEALRLTEGLGEEDSVVFLLSGGGSALFEMPLIPGNELQDVTKQLLASGADIVEMNILRKRLSAVKGGKFALHCAPARIFSIVLSDIIGDPLDMIASGPAYPDSSTCGKAKEIVERYSISLSKEAEGFINTETPKEIRNVETHVTGSVKELCMAAGRACEKLEYETFFLTDELCCEAKDAGVFLSGILKSHVKDGRRLAFIAGGETVVHLSGNGKGGRNQELALAAAPMISGIRNAAVFSVGSDGTDGPTDAAGGYVDGDTLGALSGKGIDIYKYLSNNDAYNALEAAGGLIKTGPTGTNVNDMAVALLDGAYLMTR